jgi:outer membrane protein
MVEMLMRENEKSVIAKSLFFTFILMTAWPAISQNAPEQHTSGDGEIAVNDLSVEDAVELAVKYSGEVDLQRIEFQKTAISFEEAKAQKYPQIAISSSGSWMSNPPEGISINKGAFGYAPTPQSQSPVAIPDREYVLLEDSEHTYFRIRTTLDQPLFTWGKLNAGVLAADAEKEIALIQLDAIENTVENRTRQVYFGALFAFLTRELLLDAEEAMSTIVEDRERSFDEGVIIKQDVLEAAANSDNIILQRVKADEGYRSAIEVLEFLTGFETSNVNLVSTFRNKLPDLDEKRFKDSARENSANRDVLARRLSQAETMLSIEKGGAPFRPDFFLSVALDITGQRVPLFAANWTDSWDVNLILSIGTSMTVFDSGRSGWSRRKAEQDILLAQKGIEQLEDGLQLEVRSVVEKLRIGFFEMKKAEADTALAAEQKRNADISYENELIIREQMLAARVAYILSQLQYLLTQYSYEQSLSELEYLCGIEF